MTDRSTSGGGPGKLQASSDGRGIYERIGFRVLRRFRLDDWRPTRDR